MGKLLFENLIGKEFGKMKKEFGKIIIKLLLKTFSEVEVIMMTRSISSRQTLKELNKNGFVRENSLNLRELERKEFVKWYQLTI